MKDPAPDNPSLAMAGFLLLTYGVAIIFLAVGSQVALLLMGAGAILTGLAIEAATPGRLTRVFSALLSRLDRITPVPRCRIGSRPSPASRSLPAFHPEPTPQIVTTHPAAHPSRQAPWRKRLLTYLLGQGWRSPAQMTRIFGLIGLVGLALLGLGLILPDWPVIGFLSRILTVSGAVLAMFGLTVIYTHFHSNRRDKR